MLWLHGDEGGAFELFDTTIGRFFGRCLERLDQVLKVAHSAFAVDLEQLTDTIAKLGILDGRDGPLSADAHGAHACVRGADRITDPGEKTEHGNTARPSIHLGAPVMYCAERIAERGDDFGAVECGTAAASRELCLAAAKVGGETKVEELELQGVGVNEDVFGFDITMADLKRMVNGMYC